ncbi:MAG: glutamate--tRNA ligase [Patescibacteria group bacterium]|nr:glutamate--tRNA ligase [Patescibacteria group bacterium]
MNVVTRFAPSPTGKFHAGSYRTALFSWIYAKQNNGKFILRIEDTDKERSKKEYEENIIDSLKWLGLDYDSFYRQSERTDIYAGYIKKLIDSGHAYISDENIADSTNADKSGLRSHVIRFRNPKCKIAFDDIVRGHIEFDTTELGDFVIAKDMNEPVFHLTNVIDDHDMGITHIIRGEDHISNTPRQILLYRAIGAEIPQFAHIPLLLAKDRSKLSKRNGAIPVSDYRDRGYIREAIINYMALLGWHPADDREILSIDEVIGQFSLDRVQKGGAIFDDEKLSWFNRQYMARLSDEDFISDAKPFLPDSMNGMQDLLKRALSTIRSKVSSFAEIAGLFDNSADLSFTITVPKYNVNSLLWSKNPDKKLALKHLEFSLNAIQGIEDFTMDNIKNAIWPYAEANGKGDVLWPLRYAITGQNKSPDPFTSAYIVGKNEAIKRIKKACELLAN